MENASKALLIAGAILIAILIISLAVLIFNRFGGSAKEAANMDEQEVKVFNSKITPYLGEKISGSQVNALIQHVISVDTSAVSSGDTFKAITITFPSTSGTKTIKVNGTGESATLSGAGASDAKRVTTGKYYKVNGTHDTNGLLTTLVVTE